jgi:hemoglobin
MASLFEFAGGEAGIHRLETAFYESVLADPLLQPLFGEGQAQHVDHLTAFTAESFGGPDRFSRELGGFEHLIAVHRGLKNVEFGTQVAMQNSHAANDSELHPLREVPRWTWSGDEPPSGDC